MLVAAMLWAGAAAAQPTGTGVQAEREVREGSAALVRRVQQLFEVLPLRDSVALRPKTEMRGVRSIEVMGGAIAIDGTPVTGAELRDRVSADAAQVVLELSYLDPAEQRALFGAAAPTPAAGTDAGSREGRGEPRIFRRARRNSRNDRVNVGGSVRVEAGEVVQGDAVAVGGSAHIDGEVQGDVVAIGGIVELGPKAVVGNDVTAIGGGVKRDPGAQVGGEVVEVGWGNIPEEWLAFPAWFGGWWQNGGRSAFRLAGTLTRTAVLTLFAMVIVLLAGGYVDRVSVRASAEPVKAGAIGFLSVLLFFPLLVITCIVLVLTVIGIPLLIGIPFLILAAAILAVTGFTAVAGLVGQWVAERIGWNAAGPFLKPLLGILAILSPLLIARLLGIIGVPFFVTGGLAMLGFLLECVAWMVGIGAVALAKFYKPTVSAFATPAAPTGEPRTSEG
jgi:hypothetical protein